MATTLIQTAYHWYDHHEATRQFLAQWKPGDGPFGIIGSWVEGHGPIETTKLDRSPPLCTTTVSNLESVQDADANITNPIEGDTSVSDYARNEIIVEHEPL